MNILDEEIENKISEIGGELEVIKSISRALNSALFGTDELEKKDGYVMASLLEEKISDTISKHNILVENLKI